MNGGDKVSLVIGIVLIMAVAVVLVAFCWVAYQNDITDHLHPLYHTCVN